MPITVGLGLPAGAAGDSFRRDKAACWLVYTTALAMGYHRRATSHGRALCSHLGYWRRGWPDPPRLRCLEWNTRRRNVASPIAHLEQECVDRDPQIGRPSRKV